jgi:CHAD domain-containing protein
MASSGQGASRKGGKGSGFKPQDSFRDYGERVITDRINRMLSYSRAVRRGTDADAVHDMRVASRRLRAALSVFRPAFACAEYDRLERDVKQITDALSHARDLDVMIEALTRDAALVPASQRALIVEIVRSCTSERRRLQGDVVAGLDRLSVRHPAELFTRIREAAATEHAGEAGNGEAAQGSAPDGMEGDAPESEAAT